MQNTGLNWSVQPLRSKRLSCLFLFYFFPPLPPSATNVATRLIGSHLTWPVNEPEYSNRGGAIRRRARRDDKALFRARPRPLSCSLAATHVRILPVSPAVAWSFGANNRHVWRCASAAIVFALLRSRFAAPSLVIDKECAARWLAARSVAKNLGETRLRAIFVVFFGEVVPRTAHDLLSHTRSSNKHRAAVICSELLLRSRHETSTQTATASLPAGEAVNECCLARAWGKDREAAGEGSLSSYCAECKVVINKWLLRTNLDLVTTRH